MKKWSVKMLMLMTLVSQSPKALAGFSCKDIDSETKFKEIRDCALLAESKDRLECESFRKMDGQKSKGKSAK